MQGFFCFYVHGTYIPKTAYTYSVVSLCFWNEVKMDKYLSGLLLTTMILACTACNRTFDAEDSRLLSVIEKQFCPDKRLCIWSIELNPQGRAMKLTGETDLPDAFHALTDSLQSQGFVVKAEKVKLYPDTSLGKFRFALPIPSVLNIRSEPKFSVELATQSLMGWPLVLKYRVGDWYRVQTNDGYLGWANSAALLPLDETAMSQYMNTELGVVIAENQYFLRSPGGQKVQDAISGCLVQLIGKDENGWMKVRLPNSIEAYIPGTAVLNYKAFIKQDLSTRNLTELAMEWLGRPYLWGGTSPRAMDCSGFTKMLFHHFGYSFSRDASQQVSIGDTVTTDPDLPGVIPGDLLFFGNRSDDRSQDKVTHVALYLGEGKMIHSSGQVKIESLRSDDPDYAQERYRSFLVAKRVNLRALDRSQLSYSR